LQALVNAVLVVLGCAQVVACERAPQSASCGQSALIARPGDPGIVVNGAALISAPEKFSGEIVSVTGYLGYFPSDKTQLAVFFNEQDLQYGWIAGSALLKMTDAELAMIRPWAGRRITVEGSFEVLRPPVPSEVFPIGEIRGVTQLHCVDARPYS
jgi:hypothetical protein